MECLKLLIKRVAAWPPLRGGERRVAFHVYTDRKHKDDLSSMGGSSHSHDGWGARETMGRKARVV
jgi:hypothetical protein